MLRWMKVNAFRCRVNLLVMCAFPYSTRPGAWRWDFVCSRRRVSQCSASMPIFAVEKQHVWRISSSESFTTFHFFAWSATALSRPEEAMTTMHRSSQKGRKIRLAGEKPRSARNQLENLSFSSAFHSSDYTIARSPRKISFCHPRRSKFLYASADSIM